MVGTAEDAIEFNVQWHDGVHPTAHRMLANATVPTLRVATGCRRGAPCSVPEIQSFRCAADSGAFTLSWNGYMLTNLDVRLDQEDFKRALETLPGEKGE